MLLTYKQPATDTSEEFIVCADLIPDRKYYAKVYIMSRACGVCTAYSYGSEAEFKGCYNAMCATLANVKPYEYEQDGKTVTAKGIDFGEYEKTQFYTWFATLAANWE